MADVGSHILPFCTLALAQLSLLHLTRDKDHTVITFGHKAFSLWSKDSRGYIQCTCQRMQSLSYASASAYLPLGVEPTKIDQPPMFPFYSFAQGCCSPYTGDSTPHKMLENPCVGAYVVPAKCSNQR